MLASRPRLVSEFKTARRSGATSRGLCGSPAAHRLLGCGLHDGRSNPARPYGRPSVLISTCKSLVVGQGRRRARHCGRCSAHRQPVRAVRCSRPRYTRGSRRGVCEGLCHRGLRRGRPCAPESHSPHSRGYEAARSNRRAQQRRRHSSKWGASHQPSSLRPARAGFGDASQQYGPSFKAYANLIIDL
jgi:hypothetical protein